MDENLTQPFKFGKAASITLAHVMWIRRTHAHTHTGSTSHIRHLLPRGDRRRCTVVTRQLHGDSRLSFWCQCALFFSPFFLTRHGITTHSWECGNSCHEHHYALNLSLSLHLSSFSLSLSISLSLYLSHPSSLAFGLQTRWSRSSRLTSSPQPSLPVIWWDFLPCLCDQALKRLHSEVGFLPHGQLRR